MAVYCLPPRIPSKGYTLVEILVAMLLGAFILNGLLHIFFNARQAYRVQENMVYLQENGRLALDVISQDVRMAGYWGCSNTPPSIDGLKDNTLFAYKFSEKLSVSGLKDYSLQGFEANASAWTPALNTYFTQKPLSESAVPTIAIVPMVGSDVLTVRRANAKGFLVTTQTDASLQFDAGTDDSDLKEAGIFGEENAKKPGAVVMVTDCKQAEVFQITEQSNNPIFHKTTPNTEYRPGNKEDRLQFSYAANNTRVYAINTISYYVAEKSANEKYLYRRVGVEPAEEIVEGVEDMQILYGEDVHANPQANYYSSPDYYVQANLVKDWDKVVSLRVKLLMVSRDNIAEKPVNNDKNKKPNDRKIRREFTATIAIRKRLG